jgi:hypothetical protein
MLKNQRTVIALKTGDHWRSVVLMDNVGTNRHTDRTWSLTIRCSSDLQIVILPILSHMCSIKVEHRQVFAQKTYQSSHWSQPIIGDPSSCLPHAGQIQTCPKITILKSKYRKKPFIKNWIAPSPNKSNTVFQIWIAYFCKICGYESRKGRNYEWKTFVKK